MSRKVDVEPAPSNKSTCKQCNKIIDKGQLRAKVVDDRQFREYLRKHPDARGCQGYSRGYFQDVGGVISIKKYFVHLKCYKPIYPHPKQPQYFKLLKNSAAIKQSFQQWIDGKNPTKIQEPEKKRGKSKKK